MLHIYTLLLVNQFFCLFVCILVLFLFLSFPSFYINVVYLIMNILSFLLSFFLFSPSFALLPPPPPPPKFMLRCTIVLFCYVPSLPRLFFCDMNGSVSVCFKINKCLIVFVPCNIYICSVLALPPPPPPPPFLFFLF